MSDQPLVSDRPAISMHAMRRLLHRCTRVTYGSTSKRSNSWPPRSAAKTSTISATNTSDKIGIRRSLKEFPNGDCVFFDGQTRKCQVYGARPRQCRTWPFWDSNLKTPESWAQTCEVCPGSGRGQLYSDRTDRAAAASSSDSDRHAVSPSLTAAWGAITIRTNLIFFPIS